MIRKLAMIGAAAAALLFSTAGAGCQPVDPCGRLAAPSAADVASAAGGSEVERELDEVECVVVGNRWVRQTD